MRGCIVANSENMAFASGAFSYAAQMARILDCPIYTKKSFARELCDFPVKIVYEVPEVDYYIVVYSESKEKFYLPANSKESVVLFSMLDFRMFYEFGTPRNWWDYDGYLVLADETTAELNKSLSGINALKILSPYFYQDSHLEDLRKENAVLSFGRLVPEKGHRWVAKMAGLYDVWIAGAKIAHEEYGFYYNKILNSGAKVFANPTENEKKGLFARAKVYMSYRFLPEEGYCIDYSDLEAINFGCVPILAEWLRKPFEELGFKAFYVETPSSAVKIIEEIFNNDRLRDSIIHSNKEILSKWDNDSICGSIENFVAKLKERRLCGQCHTKFLVDYKFCPKCGGM